MNNQTHPDPLSHEPIGACALRVRHVSKSFGANQALKGVSLEVAAGEVHALVGENGAGKSTLIKIVTGAYHPDSGDVEIAGQPVTEFDPVACKRMGVAAVYQQPTLFPDLSVAENLAYGTEVPKGFWIDWSSRRRRAAELLQRVGADIPPDRIAGQLSMPEQQLVEIARAIGSQARLIIMDEPTASLNVREVDRLMAVIEQLRQAGIGILYVSHRLEELARIAQRITVLRDGAWIATRAVDSVTHDELIRLMVGREVAAVFPKANVAIGHVRLSVEGLTSSAVGLRDVSFNVRAGEILGVGGLMGAGRTELAQAIFGIVPLDGGRLELDGQPFRAAGPGQAIAQGVAYLPEDRRRQGVIADMSVAANVTLGMLDVKHWQCLPEEAPAVASALRGIDWRREQALADRAVHEMQIKTASTQSQVAALSGGNQQKVALARCLATKPRLLILDEPTQGIDVGAKSEIHCLMGQLAQQGIAILVISSEILELLGVCDRILVMRQGTVSGVVDRVDATAERIMSMALPVD